MMRVLGVLLMVPMVMTLGLFRGAKDNHMQIDRVDQ